MKEKSKNLIVIIGNGFDLAHDLKTRFSDFADYYLNQVIIKELLKLNQGNKSSIIRKSFIDRFKKSSKVIYGLESTREINDDEKVDMIIAYSKNEDIKRLKAILNPKNNPPVEKLIYNSFLCNLYADKYDNWFNVEQAYYDELLNIFGNENEEDSLFSRVESLNINLTELKDDLKKYLKENINSKKDSNASYSINQHLKGRNSIIIVNFNYTNTISHYSTRRIKNIHIHGDLNSNIIFGYGDDTDDNYKRMKETKQKEFLRNFKTFQYFKSSNYMNVLNQLSTKDNYDVLIIGHSLETTDKTILKKILDTDKCDYIELLKRSDLKTEQEKEEAHFELHANLSRIFDSESDLRDKLIPFDWSVNFPIMKNIDTNIMIKRNKELYKKVPILRAVPK